MSGAWFDGCNGAESALSSAECAAARVADFFDNTEGVAAFADLPIPIGRAAVLLDVGGGGSSAGEDWLVATYGPALRVYVADPFHRSAQHNAKVQRAIEAAGGADIVTSNSVLNVLCSASDRAAHVRMVYSALKEGGTAYFKVWAGFEPLRGSGRGGR